MASVNEVDPDKYDLYAKDTAKLYVELYNWYRMPPNIHKMLIHGENSIRINLFPIGMLSEEAQEARNKDYMLYDSGDTIHEKPRESTLIWTLCTHYLYLQTL